MERVEEPPLELGETILAGFKGLGFKGLGLRLQGLGFGGFELSGLN